MKIPCQRGKFDIPSEVTYLNCAYGGPMPKSVTNAGHAGVELRARPWTLQARHFFDGAEQARSLFARLINADADSVAIIPAVSYGVEVACRNLKPKPGQEILVMAEQFPSNVYSWQDLARRSGAILKAVQRPADGDWTRAFLDSINASTAVVAFDACHWTDGGKVDLDRVGAKARSVGAAYVLDLSQLVGAVPFDVTTCQPDFAVTVGYKWLLGPYSVAFLYASPKWHDGEPIEQHWTNRRGSENFARLVEYQSDYQKGARRYDVGEKGNFTLMPMMIAALEHVLAWNPVNIVETLSGLTDQIATRAQSLGLMTAPKHLRNGHMIGLSAPCSIPAELSQDLAKANVYVSIRGTSVRISPYLYNDEADIERLFEALKQALTKPYVGS